MDREIILHRLESGGGSELIEALYSIDEDLALDQQVIERLRSLLKSESPDIREISIMRLACRSHDETIIDLLKENIRLDRDLPTFSASVRGLVCLGDNSNKTMTDLANFLDQQKFCQRDEEKFAILDQAVRDISKFKRRS